MRVFVCVFHSLSITPPTSSPGIHEDLSLIPFMHLCLRSSRRREQTVTLVCDHRCTEERNHVNVRVLVSAPAGGAGQAARDALLRLALAAVAQGRGRAARLLPQLLRKGNAVRAPIPDDRREHALIPLAQVRQCQALSPSLCLSAVMVVATEMFM